MSDEGFLEALNDAARLVEASLEDDTSAPGPPLVWIVGPPRSGTTLMSQVLVAGTNVAYIDNLAARFWSAPTTGFALSQEVLGDERGTDFRSSFGRTTVPSDPHEFGRFWREALGYDDMHQRPRSHEATIDWDHLRSTVRNVASRADRPFMFQVMLGIWHLYALLRELPAGVRQSIGTSRA